jgi:diacylglycerol kinase family enzyme
MVIPYSVPYDMVPLVKDLNTKYGINCFVSAGGDGSVHYILNALINSGIIRKEAIFLGGIGIGTANDFLGPSRSTIKGIATMISKEDLVTADIGQVSYTDIQGNAVIRFFIINASLGITAEANYLSNTGDVWLRLTKSRFPHLANFYTAVKTIILYRNFPVKLTYHNVEIELPLSNLAILKNPHLGGIFRFDQPIRPDDDRLGMNYCHNMQKWEMIRTLMDLRKGQFSGKSKRHTSFVHKLKVITQHYVSLEMDGEVESAKDIAFSIAPWKIKLLQ